MDCKSVNSNGKTFCVNLGKLFATRIIPKKNKVFQNSLQNDFKTLNMAFNNVFLIQTNLLEKTFKHI